MERILLLIHLHLQLHMDMMRRPILLRIHLRMRIEIGMDKEEDLVVRGLPARMDIMVRNILLIMKDVIIDQMEILTENGIRIMLIQNHPKIILLIILIPITVMDRIHLHLHHAMIFFARIIPKRQDDPRTDLMLFIPM